MLLTHAKKIHLVSLKLSRIATAAAARPGGRPRGGWRGRGASRNGARTRGRRQRRRQPTAGACRVAGRHLLLTPRAGGLQPQPQLPELTQEAAPRPHSLPRTQTSGPRWRARQRPATKYSPPSCRCTRGRRRAGGEGTRGNRTQSTSARWRGPAAPCTRGRGSGVCGGRGHSWRGRTPGGRVNGEGGGKVAGTAQRGAQRGALPHSLTWLLACASNAAAATASSAGSAPGSSLTALAHTGQTRTRADVEILQPWSARCSPHVTTPQAEQVNGKKSRTPHVPTAQTVPTPRRSASGAPNVIFSAEFRGTKEE